MKTRELTGARTSIAVSAIANCAFSIAVEYAADYLRLAEAGAPAATMHVPSTPLQHGVALTFGLHLDVTEAGRAHDELRFRWTSGSALLPDFRGTLRFRIATNRTIVLVDGSYLAPLGFIGRIADRVAGRRIARATLDDFAQRIAAYLGERERQWRGGLPVQSIPA